MHSVFVPEIPEGANPQLQFYLQRMFYSIAAAMGEPDIHRLDETNSAPFRADTGDIRFADGTNWDPGAGRGFYGYYSGAWHKLG